MCNPLSGKHLWFWHHKIFPVSAVPVKPCLCSPRSSGYTNKISWLCPGTGAVIFLVYHSKSGCYNRQFRVAVDISSGNFCITGLCTGNSSLHDRFEPFCTIKTCGNQYLGRLCAAACHVRKTHCNTHPPHLPLRHSFGKIGSFMQHIGR